MPIGRNDLIAWRKQRLLGTMDYLRNLIKTGAGYLLGGNGAGFVAVATTIADLDSEPITKTCLFSFLDGDTCITAGLVLAAALISFVLGFSVSLVSATFLTKFIEDERLWRTEEIVNYLSNDAGTVKPEDFEREPPVTKRVARFLKVTVTSSLIFFLVGLFLSVALLVAKAMTVGDAG